MGLFSVGQFVKRKRGVSCSAGFLVGVKNKLVFVPDSGQRVCTVVAVDCEIKIDGDHFDTILAEQEQGDGGMLAFARPRSWSGSRPTMSWLSRSRRSGLIAASVRELTVTGLSSTAPFHPLRS